MPRKTPKDSSSLFAASLPAHAAPPAAPPASVPSPVPVSTPNVQFSSAAGPPFALDPRKPRLFWNGMERKPQVTAVPTQVLEIVRPGLATDRGSELAGTSARPVQARSMHGEALATQNRLIWTNDNLVALKTLLDERDPKTRDYRYRGKVDLIYIDPPFMVNTDFSADNSIDIEIDGAEGVQAKKEPSLVELIAYKDTWRQGLDSFLSMLRARLVLLKELLSPTGSIYVHLDWHAVHYVKVMMDEIFGYENFLNEIIWASTNAHNDADRFGNIHQTLLLYAGGKDPYFDPPRVPYSLDYVQKYFTRKDERGLFRPGDLTAPGIRYGETGRPWRGIDPTAKGRHWAYPPKELDKMDADGYIFFTANGVPRQKEYLSALEGAPVQSIWADEYARYIVSWTNEGLGYPTQKPVALLSRVISASCRPGGLVLDCFVGSGTTVEAAERLGRRWIGIDNGKYGVHLARKRLIHLHGKQRPPERVLFDYQESSGVLVRKERPQRSPGSFHVAPFTVENMGVYQRAGEWQDFQTQRSRYRDEMLAVFGGKVVPGYQFLHGRKGDEREGGWVHIGPLDGPISSPQVWHIAREAQGTDTKRVTILSADFDTLSASEKQEIREKTGVQVTIRVIPTSAIDEVQRRLKLQRKDPDTPIESMAIPAFYAPLSILLRAHAKGRLVTVMLERCEVDIESFIASQRPLLREPTEGMSESARKKAQGEKDRWTTRERLLHDWLSKADTWQKFVDFWAVDHDYGHRVGEDGKPVFESDWQSFRSRDGQGLKFTAELSYDQPGHYRIAARVTDVFGNDGIATALVEVK